MLRKRNKTVIYGLYNDETDLLTAVNKANSKHLDIFDVYSPFPIHGLDPLLGLAESRLHIGGFIYGLLGTMTAFGGMTWIFTRDWPMIFGGKPYWSVPAFIPITFELTVLFASIGMVVTFYTICGLGPGVNNTILDERTSDDKFALAFDLGSLSNDKVDGLRSFLKESGAGEIHIKDI
ncbi:MAG: DUF3341 domain-containing protein [Saprospiraceae bacterium]|jgi:hypothetical protein|nr:DUF3341 domain-containing protein [Saprospiraceae bacterium]